MLTKLTPDLIPEFSRACTYERVFGSKLMTALQAYGLNDPNACFWLLQAGDAPTAALYLAENVLVISAAPEADPVPIAELIRSRSIGETDTNRDQCAALQSMLGGATESSYYMVYEGGPVTDDFPEIVSGNVHAVFSVLQKSHEYYRTHLQFDPWAQDITRRMNTGRTELYQLVLDGEVVGTGSIGSQDDECGVLAAVAVVPEYRHRGLGACISRFLVKRIQELGKTPRLISGYDEVAELYRQVGFRTCGRWGELYL